MVNVQKFVELIIVLYQSCSVGLFVTKVNGLQSSPIVAVVCYSLVNILLIQST